MFEEGALDLIGADVGAVVHDHLFLAAEEPAVAVLVGACQVAGAEPALDHHLLGRLGRAPIPVHPARRADPDPAHLPGSDRLAALVTERNAAPADPAADPALPPLTRTT